MGPMNCLTVAVRRQQQQFARIVFPAYLGNTNVDILIGLEPMK
jgi:hypothetical protein